MVIYMSRTTIRVVIHSFGSLRSLLSVGLHRSVSRGHLCAYEHVSKLERPPSFPTLVSKSTSSQPQRVYDRLHPGQTWDASSCHSNVTSNCAMSRRDDCEQGPPWNLRHCTPSYLNRDSSDISSKTRGITTN